MLSPEILQWLNLILIPVLLYVVRINDRVTRLETFREGDVIANQQRDKLLERRLIDRPHSE